MKPVGLTAHAMLVTHFPVLKLAYHKQSSDTNLLWNTGVVFQALDDGVNRGGIFVP